MNTNNGLGQSADEDAPQDIQNDLFPPPPAFYTLFTDKNVARATTLLDKARGGQDDAGERASSAAATQSTSDGSGDQQQQQQQQQKEDSSAMEVDEVTMAAIAGSDAPDGLKESLNADPVLKFMVPPEIPKEGKFSSFNASFDIYEQLPTLQELRIDQVYPAPAQKLGPDGMLTAEWSVSQLDHLRSVLKSIMVRFVELVNSLAVDPSKAGGSVAELTTLFLNAHHIINELRPHQARESLILMLGRRIRKFQAEITAVERAKATVASVFSKVADPKFCPRPAPVAAAVGAGSFATSAVTAPGSATTGYSYMPSASLAGNSTPRLWGRPNSAGHQSRSQSTIAARSVVEKEPEKTSIPPPDVWKTLDEALIYADD